MSFGCDTFGPKRIWSPDIWSPTIGPQKFGHHGQMVPNQFGSPGQMVPRIFHLSRGTGCGDPQIWRPNWLGTICTGGPTFWEPFLHGDRIWWGLLVRGSNGFGTKCIAAARSGLRSSSRRSYFNSNNNHHICHRSCLKSFDLPWYFLFIKGNIENIPTAHCVK